jgi:hypothetical protein
MTETLVRNAHRARQRVAVGLKAGAALEGVVIGVDQDGFDVAAGCSESRVRWDDVWWVFRVNDG